MAKRYYLVTAVRSTEYIVAADSDESAIDAMIAGDGIEINGDTFSIDAARINEHDAAEWAENAGEVLPLLTE